MPDRTAFVQAHEGGQPYSPAGAAAARGLEMLGWTVRLLQRADLGRLPLTPATIVVAGTGCHWPPE